MCDDFPQDLLVDELAQTEHRSEGPQLFSWFEPSGDEMTEEAWNTGYAHCLGVR